MASTSASSIQKSFKYDVFLSFRGEDTRKNFVDHLCNALKQKSIITYRDDEEINKGKRINDELIRSIEESKFYIIVFSKNYASSSWCLDELVKIMKCQKTIERTAYPVFYDVEPTEVRKQSGAVGDAFAKHEEKEAAGKWRQALSEAADLAGWELKNTLDGHEAKVIQKIVEEISPELRFIHSSVDGKLIGMETRVKDVVSSLETNICDFRMIGIKGMGGAGKTTLARAVFDQISCQFEGSSFVENVREISKNPLCGLKLLQKQVLSDVLNDKEIIVTGVYEGKNMMKQRLTRKKVLVVLDDVDHIDQVEALAGEPDWFKPGSRVIVTTREEQVLVAHKVPKNLILNVNLLSYEEAICLFSRYAFGTQVPIQGYEEHSKQVLCYAAGLPLTIRVLGSFLCGKDELEWKDALERLKTIPLKETLDKLELSYNSLEGDYKEIFLDVACILKGWEKEEAIIALECCGFHARTGLRVLEQKSLITVSSWDGSSWDGPSWDGRFNKHIENIDMHDHIEEMGQNIVRHQQPDEPYKHTRLWIKDEIDDIFVEDKGTEATRCIKVREVDPVIVMKGLRKMKGLRFLDVECEKKDYFGFDLHEADLDYSDSLYLPNSLRYLRWHCYPFKCFPKNFQANNLVGLQMYDCNIVQLWGGEERKELKKLRFIDVWYSKLRTLDTGLIPNLETLKVKGCYDLTEIRMPVESPKLKHISLHFDKLKTLNLTGAHNLETLDLRYEHLRDLQMPAETFRLKSLILSCHKLMTLDIGWAEHIEELYIKNNKDLTELHFPIEKLKLLRLQNCGMKILNLAQARNLKALELDICVGLLVLHMPVESPELETINIHRSKLRILNLGRTWNLQRLNVEECKDLQELCMPDESLCLKSIHIRCSKLITLNISGTRNLERLDLENCEDLRELHMPDESLNLKSIHIRCSKLITLNIIGAINLERLDLKQCKNLRELRMPRESLNLKSIHIHCSKLITLKIIGAINLERLDLVQCKDLRELRMSHESLSLKSIQIHCSKLITLNIIWAINLERLDLEQCEDLRELRMPDESLSLKSIYICCSKLITLNISGTRNLERLELKQCQDLRELRLPDESLSLKAINVYCSGLITLNISGARNVERLVLDECANLLELHMPDESLRLKYISIRCSKLITLNLGLSPHLECLDLHECFALEDISAPVGCLYGRVSCRPFWVNQGVCMVGSLSELHLKAWPFGICPLHPDTYLPKFNFECIYKGPLCSSTRNVKKLFSFNLYACTNLASLSGVICRLQDIRKLTLEGSIPEVPKELDQLQCLEELSLLSTNIDNVPDSICTLKHLKNLELESLLLKQLPEDLGRLECLEELTLLSTKIEHLPDSICMLKNLKILQLKSCEFLKQLPGDLGRLECLEELRLTDCKSLRDIPNSICEMKRLNFLYLTNCILVEKLPKEIGHLKLLKVLNIEGTGIRDFPPSIFALKDLIFLF